MTDLAGEQFLRMGYGAAGGESDEPLTMAPGGGAFIHTSHPAVRALVRARNVRGFAEMAKAGKKSKSEQLHEASSLVSSADAPRQYNKAVQESL